MTSIGPDHTLLLVYACQGHASDGRTRARAREREHATRTSKHKNRSRARVVRTRVRLRVSERERERASAVLCVIKGAERVADCCADRDDRESKVPSTSTRRQERELPFGQYPMRFQTLLRQLAALSGPCGSSARAWKLSVARFASAASCWSRTCGTTLAPVAVPRWFVGARCAQTCDPPRRSALWHFRVELLEYASGRGLTVAQPQAQSPRHPALMRSSFGGTRKQKRAKYHQGPTVDTGEGMTERDRVGWVVGGLPVSHLFSLVVERVSEHGWGYRQQTQPCPSSRTQT